jgi:hypothetical protein
MSTTRRSDGELPFALDEMLKLDSQALRIGREPPPKMLIGGGDFAVRGRTGGRAGENAA